MIRGELMLSVWYERALSRFCCLYKLTEPWISIFSRPCCRIALNVEFHVVGGRYDGS